MTNEINPSSSLKKDAVTDAQRLQESGLSGKAQNLASESADRLQEAGSVIKDKAVELGSERAEQATHQAAERIDRVSASIESAADSLREQDMAGLADYAEDLSVSIADISHRIKHRSVEQMLADISGVAKRNPGLFIAGSLAAGFVLARFFNASAHRSHDDARSARSDRAGRMGTGSNRGAGSASPSTGRSDQAVASNSTHAAAQGNAASSEFESRVLRPETPAAAGVASRSDKLIEPGVMIEPKSSGPISVTDRERLIQVGSTSTKPTVSTQEKK